MNLPSDLEAEENCVAASLVDREAAIACVELLTGGDFWNEQLGWCFDAITHIVKGGSSPNTGSVRHLLAQREQMQLLDADALFEGLIRRLISPSASSVLFYANIVKQRALSRRLVQLAVNLQADVATEDADLEQVIAKHEAGISQVRASTGYDDASTDAETVGEALEERMEEWLKDPRAIRGMRTGWDMLDQQINGLERKTFVLIGAATSMGKSQFILNLTRNISRLPRFEPSLLFITEMSAEACQWRLAFIEAGIDPQLIRLNARVSHDDSQRIREAFALVRSWPIRYVYRGKPTLASIQAEIRRDRARRGTQVAMVDHLGHVQTQGRDTKERTSNAAKGLKTITMDEDICIVATAHVNREGMKSGEFLRLSNFADSSDIEKEADVAILITPVDAEYRPLDDQLARRGFSEEGRGYAWVDCAKVRVGSTGAVPLELRWWDGGGRFVPAPLRAPGREM